MLADCDICEEMGSREGGKQGRREGGKEGRRGGK
jgi:hypothetical protein